MSAQPLHTRLFSLFGRERTPASMPPGMAVILALFAVYIGAFIFRTSFVINGVRRFCLFDDAMISMRYAKNFVHGAGLVWNPGGERIEGFTNPLWTLYMAFLHLLPVAPEKISLLVQLTGALCLLGTVLFARRIAAALVPGSRLAQYTAVILTAFYAPLANWCVQGMEVSVLALLATAGVWLVVRNGECVPRSLYYLLGVGTLVRIDFAVIYAATLAVVIAVDPGNRRRHIIEGGGVLVACLAGQSLLRYMYFGEFLPNTYFLKMTGMPFADRLQEGGLAFLKFVGGMSWPVFLLPFAGLLLRRDWRPGVPAILFMAQCSYSVYVGGDAWEWWGGSNRYIAVVMPLFAVMTGVSLASLMSAVPGWLRLRSPLWRPVVAAGALLVLVSLYFRLNDAEGCTGFAEWADGGVYLASSAIGNRPSPDVRETLDILEWMFIPMPLEVYENMRMVGACTELDSLTTAGARIAVTSAGALPYFADRTFIDLLGKNDRTIARLAARASVDNRGRRRYTPGHAKWDYPYSIGILKPDVVFQLWALPEEARPFLERDYRAVRIGEKTWYLLRGSRRIRWDVVERLAEHDAGGGGIERLRYTHASDAPRGVNARRG